MDAMSARFRKYNMFVSIFLYKSQYRPIYNISYISIMIKYVLYNIYMWRHFQPVF